MKAVMIGLVLGLVLSCGKKEPVQSSKVKVGAPIWEFETGGIVESSPGIGSDGTVYVGSHGRTKSSMPSMARVGSSYGNLKRDPPQPSALMGTVYVGSGDKKLYAINGKAQAMGI